MILAIDHNLDLLKCNTHSSTQVFLELNVSNNIYPCITKPTRVTYTITTLIDNIFCSEKLHHSNCSYIIRDDMSDHYPCLIILPELSDTFNLKRTIYKHTMKERNLTDLKSKLSSYDWPSILSPETCDESFNIFHTILMNSIDDACPERKIVTKGTKKKHNPWITGGILRSISKQKRLYQESLNSNVGSGNAAKYKLYKANLQRIIRKSKQDYLHKKCSEYGSNAEKMWQLVNRVIKKENNKANLVDSLTKNNIILTGEKEIADEFGDYFASIGKTLAHQAKTSSNGIDHYIDKIPREQSSLFLHLQLQQK